MSSLNLAGRFLSEVDDAITERLAILEQAHERQRAVLHFLKKCKEEKDAGLDHSDAKIDSPTQSSTKQSTKDDTSVTAHSSSQSTTSTNDAASTPRSSNSSLEEVLTRARVLRQTKQSSSAPPSRERVGSGSKSRAVVKSSPMDITSTKLHQALSIAKSQPKEPITKHAQPCASEDKEVSLKGAVADENLSDLLAQLAITTSPSYSRTTSHALSTTKELYLAQAGLLSRLHGRPSLPPSLHYEVVEIERLQSSGTRRSPPVPTPVSPTPPTNLLPMLQQLRMQYEKQWRTRLQGGELSSPDKIGLLTLWYRTRKTLQVYDGLRNGLKIERVDESDEAKVWAMVGELVDTLPPFAPRTPGKLTTLASKEWLAQSKRHVAEHYGSLQSRVEFTVESGLGKVFLKDVVKRLRECVARSSDDERGLREWQDALKAYRAAYSLLLKQAQNSNSCLFIHKC